MADRQKNCENCNQPFSYTRSTAKFCSPVCRWHHHQIKHGRQRIPDDMRYAVLLAADFRCRLCGASPKDPNDTTTRLTVDHITPVSKGGPMMDLRNMQVLCHRCNSGKSDD